MSDEPAWSWYVCQNMYLETVGSLWVRCGSRLIVFDLDSPELAPIGPDWPGLAWQIGLDLTQKHCGGFAVGSLRVRCGFAVSSLWVRCGFGSRLIVFDPGSALGSL